MNEMTPRRILDAFHEGLEEGALLAAIDSALLTALGYDPIQGRLDRHLLNNALELRGYGRPIPEQEPDRLQPYRPYPDEWIQAITRAISGRSDAPLPEVIAILKQKAKG